MTGHGTIDVFLSEPQACARDVTAQLLLTDRRFRPVGIAATAAEAALGIARLRPHVVLLELLYAGRPPAPEPQHGTRRRRPAGPPHTGLELLAAVRDASPASRCIVLSTMVSPELVTAARRLGARGYLCKGVPVEGRSFAAHLLDTIAKVAAGHFCYDPEAERHGSLPARRFTRRQQDVMRVLVDTPGATDKQIAARLAMKELTVQSHLKVITRETGVKGRGALTHWIQRHLVL